MATTDYVTAAQQWEAVLRRDRRADGHFLYAVKTTGVYCRPGCASRLPKREHVEFFADWRAAEREGFRACQRCRPRLVSGPPQVPESVIKACQLMDQANVPIMLRELAQAVGLSPFHLHRVFKAALGITPRAYAVSRRSQRLTNGLISGGSVTRAIYAAGFNSVGRCYAQAGDALGMTPGRFRDGAVGMRVRYCVTRSGLGHVLVAGTQRGICMISLGDSPEKLKRELAVRFGKAELVQGDPTFSAWVGQVVKLIDDPGKAPNLPLEIQGTAFQRRVWEALRRIPCGQTATYSEIARQLGCPDGARAVAGACAANPLVVAIPCHRVVRKGGDLSGYRWGVERKRALLDNEAGAQR
jgi:AraC family transcriptional regulator, regulatory protein of adaptative response / methylated-DNA-[protein]-cysteine methyltransferase